MQRCGVCVHLAAAAQRLQGIGAPLCLSRQVDVPDCILTAARCRCAPLQVLSSCVEPASDVWAAGVMAYQLLSGRFPFDDWAHPEAPALSLVGGHTRARGGYVAGWG